MGPVCEAWGPPSALTQEMELGAPGLVPEWGGGRARSPEF